jgi:hypothetical protein
MLVLGTVGGVVAFKANAFEAKRVTPICYSLPVNNTCLSTCTSITYVRVAPITALCYTSYIVGFGCSTSLCTSLTTVAIE